MFTHVQASDTFLSEIPRCFVELIGFRKAGDTVLLLATTSRYMCQRFCGREPNALCLRALYVVGFVHAIDLQERSAAFGWA